MADANPSPTGSTPRGASRDTLLGYLCGVTMALGAAASFVAARAGVAAGLATDDMITARYLVAGLLLAPLLWHWGFRSLAGIGWRRSLALVLTGGPPFALLQTGGYAFAPLAHGAIIAPSTVTIVGTAAAAWLLSERLTRDHLIGSVVVLAGLALIGWHGVMAAPAAVVNAAAVPVWVGDLLFFLSSLLWAAFTLLMRHWRLDALRVTTVVAVLSLLSMTPFYLAVHGFAHVATLPPQAIIVQGLMQGVVQAIITLFAYSRAVALLGVSRAVLFPATVPAITILLGIPVLGEVPDGFQVAGLVLVSVGLFIAVGVVARMIRR